MKKLIFILLLFTAAFHSYGQAPASVDLRGDSIRMYKKGGHAEFVLRNLTKDSIGPLINTGNGITEFAVPRRVNDSTIQLGPITIIIQGPGSTPGSNSSDTIYIASAVDTIFLHNIGSSAHFVKVLFAVDGDLRSSNFGDGLLTFVRQNSDSLVVYDLDTAGIRAFIGTNIGSIVITADNGLTKNTPTNVQFGGTALHNTTYDGATFSTVFTSARSGGNFTMEVDNSSSGGGLLVQGTGETLVSISTGGVALDFGSADAVTNSITKIANTFHTTSGTVANGFGSSAVNQLEIPAGTLTDATYTKTVWVNAAGKIAQYIIGTNNGTSVADYLSIDNSSVQSFATGNGFSALAAGTAFFGVGTIAGIVAEGATVGGQFENTSASTNTATLALDLGRQGVSFNGAIGNGVMIQMAGHDNTGANVVNAQIRSVFTDVTNLATKSRLDIYVNDGTGGNPIQAFSVSGLSSGLTAVAIINAQNFANNAAAITGGLTTGMLYRNGDVVQIVH